MKSMNDQKKNDERDTYPCKRTELIQHLQRQRISRDQNGWLVYVWYGTWSSI